MAISIQLSNELEGRLKESAAKAGLDINQYILKLLKEELKPKSSTTNEVDESYLIEKINLGISVATWKRFNYLTDLREREQLDPEEHIELIQLSDQIEQANAERMKYMVELAKLRNIPLKDLMKSLGIEPQTNG